MRIPMTVLKVLTIGPGVLASVVLYAAAVALLPPWIGLPAVLAAAFLTMLLAGGRLETLITCVMTGARAATGWERDVVGVVAAGLNEFDLVRRQLFVRRRPTAWTPAVTVLGHRSLVVTPGLVQAMHHDRIAPDEVVALVAHAVAAHDARRPRGELALIVAALPWRALVGPSRGVAGVVTSLPGAGLAWSLRWVIAVVCVAQSVAEGRAAAGLLAGAVIALTYVVPAASKALTRRSESAGDRVLVEHGMGETFLSYLTRHGHPVAPERRRHLLQPPPHIPRLRSPQATQAVTLMSFSLN